MDWIAYIGKNLSFGPDELVQYPYTRYEIPQIPVRLINLETGLDDFGWATSQRMYPSFQVQVAFRQLNQDVMNRHLNLLTGKHGRGFGHPYAAVFLGQEQPDMLTYELSDVVTYFCDDYESGVPVTINQMRNKIMKKVIAERQESTKEFLRPKTRDDLWCEKFAMPPSQGIVPKEIMLYATKNVFPFVYELWRGYGTELVASSVLDKIKIDDLVENARTSVASIPSIAEMKARARARSDEINPGKKDDKK